MRDELHKITDLGAQLVVVGNGKPHHAKAFIQDENLSFPVYVDPELEAYKLAGLKRGVASTFKLSSLGNAFRATRSGHKQTGLKGDPRQQGGVFVIRQPSQDVSFAYVSETSGDHPSIESIVAGLKD